MTRLFAGTPFDRPPHCEVCGKLESECTCPPKIALPTWILPEKQTARLALEKRAKGKMVTVVEGLSPTESDLPALLSKLKTTCGAGGTLQEDTIEIQGDQVNRARDALKKMGYKVK